MATGESESSWTQYSPGPYVLNFDVLASLTVQLRDEPPAVSQTVLAVVDRLRTKNPPDSGWRSLTVDTADGRHVIEGDGFCRNLLEILFEVHAKGGNALFSTWFYYDRDNTLSGHNPHSTHCFFVVDQDYIILPVLVRNLIMALFRADEVPGRRVDHLGRLVCWPPSRGLTRTRINRCRGEPSQARMGRPHGLGSRTSRSELVVRRRAGSGDGARRLAESP